MSYATRIGRKLFTWFGEVSHESTSITMCSLVDAYFSKGGGKYRRMECVSIKVNDDMVPAS